MAPGIDVLGAGVRVRGGWISAFDECKKCKVG